MSHSHNRNNDDGNNYTVVEMSLDDLKEALDDPKKLIEVLKRSVSAGASGPNASPRFPTGADKIPAHILPIIKKAIRGERLSDEEKETLADDVEHACVEKFLDYMSSRGIPPMAQTRIFLAGTTRMVLDCAEWMKNPTVEHFSTLTPEQRRWQDDQVERLDNIAEGAYSAMMGGHGTNPFQFTDGTPEERALVLFSMLDKALADLYNDPRRAEAQKATDAFLKEQKELNAKEREKEAALLERVDSAVSNLNDLLRKQHEAYRQDPANNPNPCPVHGPGPCPRSGYIGSDVPEAPRSAFPDRQARATGQLDTSERPTGQRRDGNFGEA